MGKCRQDDKLEEDLETWKTLIARFSEGESADAQTTLVEDTSSG